MPESDHVAPLSRDPHVLVVDADPTHRLLAIRLLQRLGAVADGARSADEAMERATGEPYDAMLVDADLAAAATDRLPARLRSTGRAAGDPVLVVMGFAGAEEPDDRRPPAGFDLVTDTPVSITHLQEILAVVDAARPAPAPVAGEAPAIDRDTLRRLADDLGDTSFVAETVRLYLAELPERLALLETGLSQGDVDAVRSTAHSLKSASAMLGAGPLSASCLALERAAAEQRLSREGLHAVRAQAEEAALALRDYLAS